MDTSFVVGRTGSIDDETGLFVLEGSRESFMLTPETVAAVGGSRERCEVNSGAPFREDKAAAVRPVWLNQAPTYGRTVDGFSEILKDLIEDAQDAVGKRGSPYDLKDIDQSLEGAYHQLHMKKLRERRYITEWAGISPEARALKVIGKQQGMSTKRIVLFATGVPQHRGGRTWLVTNSGFSWWNGTSKVVVDSGGDLDLTQAVAGEDFLFFAVTNAVPFIAGHRKLQRDENNPRILEYTLDGKSYDETIEDTIANMVFGASNIIETTTAIQKLYMAGKKSGAVQAPARDFGLGKSVINLGDEDMMW
jgi:hypothetical protein